MQPVRAHSRIPPARRAAAARLSDTVPRRPGARPARLRRGRGEYRVRGGLCRPGPPNAALPPRAQERSRITRACRLTSEPVLEESPRAVVRDSVGVGLAVGAYGVAFGAASVAAGLSVLQTSVLSLLAFTGGT